MRLRNAIIGVFLVILVASLGYVFVISSSQDFLLSVSDPAGDDYGPGTYTYPVHEHFMYENFGIRQNFDILEFKVKEESKNIVFVYEMADEIKNPMDYPLGMSPQAIDIYLDTEPNSGYTDLVFDKTVAYQKNPNGTLNAVIAEDDAWEYAIRVQGYEISIFTTPSGLPDNKISFGELEINGSTASVTVPKHVIGDSCDDWDISTFLYSVDWGNARVVDAHALSWQFGGGRDDNTDPNIIDLVVPSGKTQEEVLNFEKSSPVTIPALNFKAGEVTSEKGKVKVETVDPGGVDPSTIDLDNIIKRGVSYFWEMANPNTGLVRDSTKYPDEPWPASIAATGFGLTALPIGAERGWLDNDAVYDRILTTLKFVRDNVEGKNGYFYHWVENSTGNRWVPEGDYEPSEVSSIDTALLIAGALTAGEYYKGTKVEDIAHSIYENVQWDWLLSDDNIMYHGWSPERGFLPNRWSYYSEAMILYLLAMGAPNHSIPSEAWDAWSRPIKNLLTRRAYVYSPSESLFTYQFSHAWIDFRNKHDNYANYYQNSINAAYNNRDFCIDISFKDEYSVYGPNIWGLTAGDGPDRYVNYGAHLGGYDGTVNPYGMVASMPFVPDFSKEGIDTLLEQYGREIWGEYGFTSGFNPIPDWYSETYTGIDIGIQVLMLQNYKDNFVWDLFMQNEAIQRGMENANFVKEEIEGAITEWYENQWSGPVEVPRGVAMEAETSLTVDGDLSDWQEANWYEVPTTPTVLGIVHPVHGLGSEFSAMWNDSYLYLAANVKDNVVVSNISPDDVRAFYRTDSIEFYIQPDRFVESGGGLFKLSAIPFDTEGNPQAARHEDVSPGPISQVAPKVEIASTETSDGYIMEFAIPWEYLDLNPQDNLKIGLNHTVHDTYFEDAGTGEYVRTGMISWSPVPVVWTRPDAWGIMRLEEK